MYSPAKHEDRLFLKEIGELIQLLVKVGTKDALDLAEKFGTTYEELENRIKTNDYSRLDELYKLLDSYPHTPLNNHHK